MHISNAPAGVNKLYTSRLQHVLPVADPGLSVRGGRIKQTVQKGVGAGGGVAPSRPSQGVWGSNR